MSVRFAPKTPNGCALPLLKALAHPNQLILEDSALLRLMGKLLDALPLLVAIEAAACYPLWQGASGALRPRGLF